MALYPTLGATHSLAGDSPQEPLTLIAVSGSGGRPNLKVMRCGAGYGVDESLQGLLVHVVFLGIPGKHFFFYVSGRRKMAFGF